ncbi:MAG: FAD-dependent oxidoreductase [Rhodobacteraceae bacterium]|nr:FAD-dependent oxidoreductase [Paracoccaceae bacterium]
MTQGSHDCDVLIVGGGFFGASLALFLSSVTSRITVVESGADILTRASRVNQARIHTGFHYPRSMLTAAKSMVLHRRFAEDFPEAVVDDFRMLYAVSRRNSRVTAGRFWRMFHDLGARISPANAGQAALFDPEMTEAVFECDEFAFDYSVLQRLLRQRLEAQCVDLRLNTSVSELQEAADSVHVTLSDGSHLRAGAVFNVTYSNVNRLLETAGIPAAQLKHELAEIALVQPPPELAGLAVTMMDGPFFSLMPYPAENLYSLTHVRYTPHLSWPCASTGPDPGAVAARFEGGSKAQFMQRDASRYMPCLSDLDIRRSLYEVKTVLMKNEQDDGRPILFHRYPSNSQIMTVLGGKIDNIYDLFDLVRTSDPSWRQADLRHLVGEARA